MQTNSGNCKLTTKLTLNAICRFILRKKRIKLVKSMIHYMLQMELRKYDLPNPTPTCIYYIISLCNIDDFNFLCK